jgi:hypothetical protein
MGATDLHSMLLGLRYTGLYSVEVHALGWNATQGLKLPFAHTTQLLKVAEKVLRGVRSDNGDDSEVWGAMPVDPAFPGFVGRIVLDLDGALRPNVSSPSLLRQQPNLMAFRKMLERSTHRVGESFALRLSSLKRLARARIGDFYLPAQQSTRPRRYPRPYPVADNPCGYRVHVVNIIDDRSYRYFSDEASAHTTSVARNLLALGFSRSEEGPVIHGPNALPSTGVIPPDT